MVNRLIWAGDVGSEPLRQSCKPYLPASHFWRMPYWLCDCVRALGHHHKFQECPLAHTASSPWIRDSLKDDCNHMNGVSCFILLLQFQLQLEGDSPSQSPRLWSSAPHAWHLMTVFVIRLVEAWEDCEKLSLAVAQLHRVLSGTI